MTHIAGPGKAAQLANVFAFSVLVDKVMNRHPGLPPLGVFSGRSGLGKTIAATEGAHLYRAYYVEMKSIWTRKRLFEAICQEMGITHRAKTAVGMFDQVCEELAVSNRPLFIDDAQFLGRNLELVRDIAEGSQGAVILIGEEALPMELRKWERIDNRVLVWEQAKPCTAQDAAVLAGIYAEGVTIAEDLLAKICASVTGCTRRVCVNLFNVREFATARGLAAIDAATFTDRLYTGSQRG